MYKVGQDIDVGGGLRARVQEDEQGNLFYTHPQSKNRTILVPAEHRQDLIGGESVETNPRDFSPFRATEDARIYPGDITQSEQGSILNSLLGEIGPSMPVDSDDFGMDELGLGVGGMEGAHNQIDGLMMENELSKMTSQSPGSRLRGPLDTLGATLSEYLIGQNPETGEIPYNRMSMSEEQLRNERIEKYKRYGTGMGFSDKHSIPLAEFLSDILMLGRQHKTDAFDN